MDDNESLISGEINCNSFTEKTFTIEGMELCLRVEEPGSGQFYSTSCICRIVNVTRLHSCLLAYRLQ